MKFNIFKLFNSEAERFQKLGGFDDEKHLIALFTSMRKCFNIVNDSLEGKKDAPFIKVNPSQFNASKKITKIKHEISTLGNLMEMKSKQLKVQENVLFLEREKFIKDVQEIKEANIHKFEDIKADVKVPYDMISDVQRESDSRLSHYFEEKMTILKLKGEEQQLELKNTVEKLSKEIEEKNLTIDSMKRKISENDDLIVKGMLSEKKHAIEKALNDMSQEINDAIPFELTSIGKEPLLWYIIDTKQESDVIAFQQTNKWKIMKEEFKIKRDKEREQNNKEPKQRTIFQVDARAGTIVGSISTHIMVKEEEDFILRGDPPRNYDAECDSDDIFGEADYDSD